MRVARAQAGLGSADARGLRDPDGGENCRGGEEGVGLATALQPESRCRERASRCSLRARLHPPLHLALYHLQRALHTLHHLHHALRQRGELMNETTSQRRERWGASIVVLHWATVACVIALLGTGWQLRALMGDLGPYTAALRLHASLGILLLAVTMVRVIARLVARRPSAPTNGRLRRVSAGLVQAALYVTLLAIIATGIVAAAPRPFMPTVQLFGIWPLPRIATLPPELMRSMPRIHATLIWLLLALVGFHVAAAIYGTLIAGERTIFRMLPWKRRGQRT